MLIYITPLPNKPPAPPQAPHGDADQTPVYNRAILLAQLNSYALITTDYEEDILLLPDQAYGRAGLVASQPSRLPNQVWEGESDEILTFVKFGTIIEQ